MTISSYRLHSRLLPIPYDQNAFTWREFYEHSSLQNNQIHSTIEQTIDGILKHVFLSLSGTTKAENLLYPSPREELFLIREKDQGEVTGKSASGPGLPTLHDKLPMRAYKPMDGMALQQHMTVSASSARRASIR